MISRIIDSSKCDYCKRLTALQGARYKHCFMVKYLSPTEAENIFILHDTSEYHTHAGQVLTDPVINFVQLPSGDVGYKISNTEEINISLCSNPLYLAAQKEES